MAINHGNHSEPAVSSKMLGFAIFFLIHLFHSSLNKHLWPGLCQVGQQRLGLTGTNHRGDL